MRFISWFSFFTAVAFATPIPIRHQDVQAASPIQFLKPRAPAPAVMHSVSDSDLAQFMGLQKRDVNFADLDLRDRAQMLYGTPGNDGSVLLANVTLIAPSGKKLVMMERFEGLTSSIDCEGSDGEIGLTFTSADALSYAEKAWAGGEFILVANHDGCSDAQQRKAYTISNVKVDTGSKKAALQSTPIDWKEVTGTFSVDFGKLAVKPKRRVKARQETPVLVKKGLFDKIKETFNEIKDGAKDVVEKVKNGTKDLVDKVKEKVGGVVDKVEEKVEETKEKVEEKVDDVKDKVEEVKDKIEDKFEEVKGKTKEKAKEVIDKIVEAGKKGIDKAQSIAEDIAEDVVEILDGDADLNGDFSIDLNTNTQGKRMDIFTDKTSAFPNLVITCVDCYVEGKLRFAGRVEVTDFKVTTLEFDGFSTDLAAQLALEVFMKKAESENVGPSFSFEQSIFALPLPGGIVIPSIFSAGPKLDFKAGIDSSIIGVLNATLGARAEIPDTARLHANVLDSSKSSATGFDQFSVSPIFNINQATASYNVGLFASPVLTLGFDILGTFGFETQLRLTAPRLSAKVEVGAKEGGFCSGKEGDAGVSVSSSIGTNLIFGVKAKTGDTVGESLFETVLFNKSKELANACFAIPEVDV